MYSLRLQKGPTPPISKYVIKLERQRHFRIQAELRRQHCPILLKLFAVFFWVSPNRLKFIIIQKEMNDLFCLIFVELIIADKLNIFKPNLFPLYHRHLKNSLRIKLISEKQWVCSKLFTRQTLTPQYLSGKLFLPLAGVLDSLHVSIQPRYQSFHRKTDALLLF